MKTNFILLCLVSALLLSYAPTAMPLTCDPYQLSSCAGPIFSGSQPSATCCNSLKKEQPCFCQFLSNPNLSPYINSENGRTVAAYCKVSIPSC
ncbi:putative non-specific lipid-transfer protein AKCS9 [Dendrobium catenatum]|uniref:Putative non-specific lipid-transfer protein AKCS9 n=1 Tax=Dendrobium catenatum TaxID=906689 RepID=A0A2I0VZN1_9ASPA|nr:putative non-specific lipid-transfer protein AKCS9 [Dendrobium catenatum]